MIQEIIALAIVGIAAIITAIYFIKKYYKIRKNESTCGSCSNSNCDGCALTKISKAKKN